MKCVNISDYKSYKILELILKKLIEKKNNVLQNYWKDKSFEDIMPEDRS